jgi:hypothetical protein
MLLMGVSPAAFAGSLLEHLTDQLSSHCVPPHRQYRACDNGRLLTMHSRPLYTHSNDLFMPHDWFSSGDEIAAIV